MRTLQKPSTVTIKSIHAILLHDDELGTERAPVEVVERVGSRILQPLGFLQDRLVLQRAALVAYVAKKGDAEAREGARSGQARNEKPARGR